MTAIAAPGVPGPERVVPPAADGALRAVELLASRLELVMEAAGNDFVAQRARTTAAFTVGTRTGGSACVRLCLDGRPAPVDREFDAEIRLQLTTSQARSFALGRLAMPPLIVAGEIPVSGPARKLLTVVPILRARLARMEQAIGPGGGDTPG